MSFNCSCLDGCKNLYLFWYYHVGMIHRPNLALVFHLFIIFFTSNTVFVFYLVLSFFPTPFGIHCNIPLVHLIWHAIKVYFCSLFLRHRTLCFSTSTEWNKLPVDIRCLHYKPSKIDLSCIYSSCALINLFFALLDEENFTLIWTTNYKSIVYACV